jgi:hypothetical protein
MKGINLIHMKSNVRYTSSFGSVTRKMQVLNFSLSTAEMFKFVIVYHVVSLLDIKADIYAKLYLNCDNPMFRDRGSIPKVGHWPKGALLYVTKIKRFYVVHEPKEKF